MRSGSRYHQREWAWDRPTHLGGGSCDVCGEPIPLMWTTYDTVSGGRHCSPVCRRRAMGTVSREDTYSRFSRYWEYLAYRHSTNLHDPPPVTDVDCEGS